MNVPIDDGVETVLVVSLLIIQLRQWVAEFNISMRALGALLRILKALCFTSLPTDARTVMRTPRSVKITKIENRAEYWHQGVDVCLRNNFADLSKDTTISVNINVDGLPLFDSATKCFWPILMNIHEYPSMHPMAIGVFYGEKKPEDVQLYFQEFVDDFKDVLENGITINGHTLTVLIRCIICDSPARAFVKGTIISFIHLNDIIYIFIVLIRL